MASSKQKLGDIEAALRLHVDRLAGLIGPRTLSRPKSIEATIGYIDGAWRTQGYEVSTETYDVSGGVTVAGDVTVSGDVATNLFVEIPGRSKADRWIVVGAHYDTVSTTPGADDNASAVAVMLEVSRLLREHRPRRSVRFVAFACEEPPYFHTDSMGSQHHARSARRRNEKIDGMICLESVGYFRDEPGSQQLPPGFPEWSRRILPDRGDFLAAVGNLHSKRLAWGFRGGFRRGLRRSRLRLPLWTLCLPERINAIRLSDNSSFWDQGYPALMVTDTAFLRNPNYHEPTDTPETLDHRRMTAVTVGVTEAARRLAG